MTTYSLGLRQIVRTNIGISILDRGIPLLKSSLDPISISGIYKVPVNQIEACVVD